METMTMREFLVAIANGAEITAEIKAFANERIEKLDATNEKRRNTKTSKQTDNDSLKVAIIETLKANPEGLDSATVGIKHNISTAKASAMLTQLVKSEQIAKEERKIPKRGKVNFYVALA